VSGSTASPTHARRRLERVRRYETSLGALGCRYLSDNEGLCGPLVDVGILGTTYTGSGGGGPLDGTNLGNDCPPGLPCCDELRENPVFCCLEARRPEFALSVCEPSC
jgi:hypothetical protein